MAHLDSQPKTITMFSTKTLLAYPIIILAAVTLTLTSCDDDEATPSLKLSDLEGQWVALSLTHTNNADESESFDMIANGGEVRVTVLPGGRVRTFVEFGTYSDEWDSRVTLSGKKLRSVPAEAIRGVQEFTIELRGNTLTLTNTDDSFDFTLMNGDEVSTTSVGQYELQ